MKRSLLAAVLYVFCLSSLSLACSGPQKSVEDNFSSASEVFVAHVIHTEEKSLDPDHPKESLVVEGTYKVIETIKGDTAPEGVVRDAMPGYGNCELGLRAGMSYIFFIHDRNRIVLFPGGSKGFVNIDATDVKAELAKLRNLAKVQRKQ